jgi:hypothetical protein
MQVLALFLVLAFVLGGSELGRHVRQRPILLLFFSTTVAVSFYSLRVAS